MKKNNPKVAITALTKKVKALIPESEEMDVDYYNDVETSTSYIWKMLWKDQEITMIYDFDTKKIEVLTKEVRKEKIQLC